MTPPARRTKPTTFTRIRTQVVFVIAIGFPAGMAIVAACEEPRHFRDHIVVVVVQVQIDLLVFVWTGVDDFIIVFFRHDIDLILGQVQLKFLSFFYTTRTHRNTCVGIKFLSQSGLHRSVMISYLMVLWIVIKFGFSHHESTKHKSSLFWMRITDLFFFKCSSKFRLVRFPLLPPEGKLNWMTFTSTVSLSQNS